MASSSSPPAVESPGRRWMRWCLVFYLIFLTYVLLAPDPYALFRLFRSPSATPPEPLPPYLSWLFNDKVEHFTAYGILTALLFAATRWNSAVVLAASALHGGGMEILQQWFPPRSMELKDWIADLSGATAVVVIHRLLPRRRSD